MNDVSVKFCLYNFFVHFPVVISGRKRLSVEFVRSLILVVNIDVLWFELI